MKADYLHFPLLPAVLCDIWKLILKVREALWTICHVACESKVVCALKNRKNKIIHTFFFFCSLTGLAFQADKSNRERFYFVHLLHYSSPSHILSIMLINFSTLEIMSIIGSARSSYNF